MATRWAVLKGLAEHLRLQLRGQDIVARLGGDEFLVVQLGVKDVDEASEIAQRVCEPAGQPHDYAGIDYVPHVSIGVALASSGEPIDEVIARADAAPYRATAGWAPTWVLPRRRVSLPTGVQLAYADVSPLAHGAAAGRPAPVMVLIHGYTNDADSWAVTVGYLRELLPDHRFVIPDMRGHGASSLPVDGRWRDDPAVAFTMGALAVDVVALMDALGIRTAIVSGHSMGSLVAQVMAADHPERVSSMVLVSTTGDARGTPFLADWLRNDVISGRWQAALAAQGVGWPDEAMDRTPLDADPDAVAWLQQFWNFYPLTPGRSTLELAQRAARLPLATWVGALEGILSTNRLAALRACPISTFVLWGTQDSFFRRSSQEALIDAARGRNSTSAPAELDAAPLGRRFMWKQYGRLPLPADGIQADDLGHNLTWDAPAAVAADVASFVSCGMPTSTWFRSDAPQDPYRIIGEPDAAVVVDSK